MADDETEDEDFDYGDSGRDVWLNKDERDLIRKNQKDESDRIEEKEKKLKKEREKAIEPHKHKVLSHKTRKRRKKHHTPKVKCSICGKSGHWARECPHDPNKRRARPFETYGRQSPNYRAMRKARQFLGIAKRARPAVPESKLCPPFDPHGTTPSWDLSAAFTQTDAQGETTKQTGKERIHCQDIDAIVARKYWSMFSPGHRTRPLRQSADGWGGRETDWVLWELFVHLTIGNGVVSPKPWFVSKWIDEHGMSDKFLLMGGPCSRECIEFLSRTTMTRPEEAVGGMIQLLADRGLEVPSDVAELASQLYEASLPSLGELGELSLHLDGQELEFHLGRLLWTDVDERDNWVDAITAMSDDAITSFDRVKGWDEELQVLTLEYIDEDGAKTTETLDLRNFTTRKEVTNKDGQVDILDSNLDNGDEWWDEERHTPYKMRHIPVAFSIMQAMYEKNMHHSETYAYLGSVLQAEVSLYTSMEFADACEAWASAIGGDRKAWRQY